MSRIRALLTLVVLGPVAAGLPPAALADPPQEPQEVLEPVPPAAPSPHAEPTTGDPAAAADREGRRGAERFPELAWLAGEWQGFDRFPERTTYVHQAYSFDLGGMFFVERTLDVFPPPEPSTDFELHQDLTVFYRDAASGEIRARGFFAEGFVTASAVEARDGGGVIVIESREVDAAPPGLRSRITLTRQSPDRFTGLFELALPGQDFQVMERLEMKRID
jgi:hypothetical protein